jgi:hypothetical protein
LRGNAQVKTYFKKIIKQLVVSFIQILKSGNYN